MYGLSWLSSFMSWLLVSMLSLTAKLVGLHLPGHGLQRATAFDGSVAQLGRLGLPVYVGVAAGAAGAVGVTDAPVRDAAFTLIDGGSRPVSVAGGVVVPGVVLGVVDGLVVGGSGSLAAAPERARPCALIHPSAVPASMPRASSICDPSRRSAGRRRTHGLCRVTSLILPSLFSQPWSWA